MAGQPIVIDLPMPPSVNAIWRSKRSAGGGKPIVYQDRRYAAWKRECDALCLAHGWHKKPIKGEFTVDITIDVAGRRKNSDLDNLCKAPLDFLQRAGIVENDKLATYIVMRWGYVADGCCIVVAKDDKAPSRSKPVLGWAE